MSVIILRDQRKAYVAGVEQTGQWIAGQKVWSKPPSIPVISVDQTGSRGYAGSTYRSTVAAQWTADGVDIPGATGTTYVMSLANEGKAIRCGLSNTIQMWTPYQFAASARLYWLDMRKATLVDGKIDSVADSWGSAIVAAAPASGLRPNTTILNGQLTAFRSEGQYTDSRRLAVPIVAGLAEVIVGYRTPASYAPNPLFDDLVLMGAENVGGNGWRRIRTVPTTPAFATEGTGTFVDDVGASTGVAQTARMGAWRTSALATTGLSLWARSVEGSNGGLPGWQFQAFGLNRATSNIERRMFNAYIAWLYGGSEAAALLGATTYRTAPPRVQG